MEAPRLCSILSTAPTRGALFLATRFLVLLQKGPLPDSNRRPRAPKARIIPLDQVATFGPRPKGRRRQDSNLRGVTPVDFESTALTARPQSLRVERVKKLHINYVAYGLDGLLVG